MIINNNGNYITNSQYISTWAKDQKNYVAENIFSKLAHSLNKDVHLDLEPNENFFK